MEKRGKPLEENVLLNSLGECFGLEWIGNVGVTSWSFRISFRQYKSLVLNILQYIILKPFNLSKNLSLLQEIKYVCINT